MGYTAIARLLKVPFSTVRSTCVSYEKEHLAPPVGVISKKPIKPCEASYIIEQSHIKFLTSESTLLAWVTKSIKDRCVLFHRSYPDKFIKPWKLRAVYRANLIKKKAILTTKMPLKAADGRYEPLKEEMRRRMKSAIKRKLKIIYLDETMFTKHTNLSHAWSKRTKNIHVPGEAMGIRYTAVIAAISENCGFELIELHDSAVDENKFSAFLYKLHDINKGNKVVIVMDNLGAHKTDMIKR